MTSPVGCCEWLPFETLNTKIEWELKVDRVTVSTLLSQTVKRTLHNNEWRVRRNDDITRKLPWMASIWDPEHESRVRTRGGQSQNPHLRALDSAVAVTTNIPECYLLVRWQSLVPLHGPIVCSEDLLYALWANLLKIHQWHHRWRRSVAILSTFKILHLIDVIDL